MPGKDIRTEEGVKAIFARVNAFLGHGVEWGPLKHEDSAGTSNLLFRGGYEHERLVLRINVSEKRSFGVSRHLEAAVLAMIEGYDWAPKIVHNAWREGWCLMKDYEGLGSTPTLGDDYFNIQHQILCAVNDWQSIPHLPAADYDYDALFRRYRRAVARFPIGHTRSFCLDLLTQIESGLTELPEVPVCLTHHDLHPGNVCWSHGQPIILDWEYGGFGNPWFDAQGLHSQFGVSPAVIQNLSAFASLSNKDFISGLAEVQWIAEALGEIWLLVKSEGVAIDVESDPEL